MKLTIIKQLNGTFKVAYPSDYENAKKIPLNEPFEINYKKSRNYKFLQKFFVLVQMVYDNQEQYNNIHKLRSDLIIESGYFTEHVNFHGEVRKEAISISYESMDEIEFNEFYARFVDAIVRVYKWDKQDLVDAVLEHF